MECKTCRWWRGFSGGITVWMATFQGESPVADMSSVEFDQGECKRHAPCGRGQHHEPLWPVTKPSDSCGDHQEK